MGERLVSPLRRDCNLRRACTAGHLRPRRERKRVHEGSHQRQLSTPSPSPVHQLQKQRVALWKNIYILPFKGLAQYIASRCHSAQQWNEKKWKKKQWSIETPTRETTPRINHPPPAKMEEENGVQLKLYLATPREKGVAPIYQSASNQIDCLEGGDEKKKI